MKILDKLYNYTLRLAGHAKATYYLFVLSVAESSFFPIPPDVMLAPMCLAQPNKLWRFAFLTTIGSVLGGLLGYLIGMFSFDYIEPVIEQLGYMMAYKEAVHWFNMWGFWAILIAGFSPIPYKVFTIAAGVLNMAIIPFVIGSILGRGARFYLVAFFVKLFGNKIDFILRTYMNRIGWGVCFLIFLALVGNNL
jgi:membrane protein YqaA with SNARE-associated domain|tara:strand:- start:779 stop:1357 length:579 start_codon:yes stop_codon:yes gene_type:complete